MKRLSSALFILILLANSARAEKLPDGTAVDGSLIENFNRELRQYTFKNPHKLNTPYGIKEVKSAGFNPDGSLNSLKFASIEIIETPAGEVSVSEVDFHYHSSRPYASRVKVADQFILKIPPGDLYLGAGDIMNFDNSGNIHLLTMNGRRTLLAGKSTLYISGNIIRNAGYTQFSITLAEPAEIRSPAGRLTFRGRLMYSSGGSLISGELDKPQKAKTPQGKFSVTAVTLTPEGRLLNCTLAGAESLDTLWGKIKLIGSVRFAENGKVDSGRCDGVQRIPFSFGKCRIKGSFYFDYAVMKSGFELAEEAEIMTPFGKLLITTGFGTHPDGNLAWFTPVNELKLTTPFGEFLNQKNRALGIHRDGSIEYFNITETRVITTHAGKFSVSGVMHLHNNGMIKSAELQSPVTIKSSSGNLTANSFIEFYDNGILKYCTLGKKAVFKTGAGSLPIEEFAAFYENGSFMEGKLASSVKIKGITYRAGTVIMLNEKGETMTPLPGK